MPWRHAAPTDQRTQFMAEHLRGGRTITELCDDYGASRKTGYKWLERYLRHGPAGLEERSRRPRRSPNETAEEIGRMEFLTGTSDRSTAFPPAGVFGEGRAHQPDVDEIERS